MTGACTIRLGLILLLLHAVIITAASVDPTDYYKDTSIPLKTRMAKLKELAAKGDTASVDILLAVAKASIYLNRYAAEALGDVKTAAEKGRIKTFLEAKLSHANALYAAACIRGYTRNAGAAASSKLKAVLSDNTARKDGYSEMVCSAAVEALGQIAAKDAVTVLGDELDQPGTKGWTLEYGSRILRSLELIGDKSAKADIQDYAARLEADKPDDPLAKKHYEDKIAEANRIAAAIDDE